MRYHSDDALLFLSLKCPHVWEDETLMNFTEQRKREKVQNKLGKDNYGMFEKVKILYELDLIF